MAEDWARPPSGGERAMNARMPKVTVLGGGTWGTTVASIAARRTQTQLWVRDPEIATAINETHRNRRPPATTTVASVSPGRPVAAFARCATTRGTAADAGPPARRVRHGREGYHAADVVAYL